MAVGLYAGSFDPIHRGHVDLIEAAGMCLDRLFVVVSTHQGLLVDLAKQLDVDVLVRGMGKEPQFELQMAATNTNLPGLGTLFFAPSAATAHISSRMIRERIRRDGVDAVADLVPAPVAALLGASAALSGR
ncbi:MAG TPA: adenylyltransferase/cytidyltransferase family protein [Acidimicrobiales bacterium]|nr:adenylyltransferase/cytidyltransferase family protein [Acidimicrobiales bacterium]